MNFRNDHYIEPWKVFAFTFITLGLYQFYWIFYTWKFIEEESEIKVNPLLRTLAIFLSIGPIAILFYDILRITTKTSRTIVLFIAILLPVLDHIIGYNYNYQQDVDVLLKILTLIFSSFVTSSIFAFAQLQINKYLIEKNKNAEEIKIRLINTKTSLNPRIFQVVTICCALIDITLMYLLNLDDLKLVLITSLLVVIATYITTEIYEKKGIKNE